MIRLDLQCSDLRDLPSQQLVQSILLVLLVLLLQARIGCAGARGGGCGGCYCLALVLLRLAVVNVNGDVL